MFHLSKDERCPDYGRNILPENVQTLWGVKLTYCAKHRKYGANVFREILKDYLRNKHEKFRDQLTGNLPKLCDCCSTSMSDYFEARVQRVYELEELKDGLEEMADSVDLRATGSLDEMV